MAAPSYTEDLTDIALAEIAETWTSFSTNQQGTYSFDNDYPYIQGSYACSQTCSKSKTVGNLGYDYGSDPNPGTDDAMLVWQNFSSPTAIDDYAGTITGQAGMCILMGNSISNFDIWEVGGSDISPYPYGGWVCHAVCPSVTADDVTNGPRTSEQFVGAQVNLITYPSKGEPHAVDVMRFGRCSAIFEHGDLGNGYATIAGFAAQNDNSSNRWGLIQETAGGYLWQGRMQLGTSTNAVDFRDSNTTIFIKWNPKVTYNFNTIEIKHIDSNVEMTGFTFQVLDITTASPGRLIMSDPADVAIDQCGFVDMGEFSFDTTAGFNIVNITDTTFRRCGEITQGGATFDGCSILNSDSTSSIQADNLDEISNCAFESDGSNHAIELDDNHAGGTYSITGCTYTDYETSNGSTGNEPIYNNSGGAVTINVVGGDYPYYRNGPGSTTTVVQAVNWYFKIVDQAGTLITTSEFRIYDENGNQLYGVETSDGTELYQFDFLIAGDPARIVVHDLNYIHSSQILNHPSSSNTADAPVVIALVEDRVYDNPVITHTETWGNRPTDTYRGVVIDTYNSLINNRTTFYGSSEDLTIMENTDVRSMLFGPKIYDGRFPSNAVVISATLYLYIHTNNLDNTKAVNGIQVNKNWVESESNGDEYSTGNSWAAPGGGLGTADVYIGTGDTKNISVGQLGWVSYVLTDDIQDWIDGVRSDMYGWSFLHSSPGNSVLKFASSQYTTDPTKRPYLKVIWTS